MKVLNQANLFYCIIVGKYLLINEIEQCVPIEVDLY